MKTLYILRHAKADRGGAYPEDFERPLAEGGRADAARMAEAMGAAGIVPALVLCSAARRALETWEILAKRLGDGGGVPVDAREALYLAPVGHLLTALRRLPDAPPSVLLIGHNPGLRDLGMVLAGPRGEAEALGRLRAGLPTAAMVELGFDLVRWAELGPGAGRLSRVLCPFDVGVTP